MPQLQLFMKEDLIISSVEKVKIMTGIRFISRDMRPLESTQGPSLKAGYLNSSLKISDGNLNPKADFLPIHIPGLCLNFGNSRLFLWGWALLWQFTRQGLIAILKIVDLKRKIIAESGLSSVMAKLMNPNHWELLLSLPGKSLII